MANVRLLFEGTEKSGTEDFTLEVFINNEDEIFIEVNMQDNDRAHICLDKSTAIKFAKTLRAEINKIQ